MFWPNCEPFEEKTAAVALQMSPKLKKSLELFLTLIGSGLLDSTFAGCKVIIDKSRGEVSLLE